MKVSPKQASYIAHSTAFLNVADGAVRSGKTFSALQRFVEFCRRGPKGDLMMLGKTERTIKRNAVHPLEEMLPGGVKYVQGAGELNVLGRMVYIVGANDAQAETKIRGATLAGAYWNELSLAPHTALQTLIDRCSVEGSQIFADTNPDSPFHWLNKEYLSAGLPKSDVKRWRFGLDDNPVLAESYKERLKRVHTGVWYRRMVLGEWVAAEGAVYDAFDPDGPMVVDILPTNFERVVVGVDYGTANATVFLKLGLANGKWWLFGEYTHDSRASGRQKTDAEYADEFLEWLAPHTPHSVEVDPSAASFKLALRRKGVSNVRDADNSVLDGIRAVATGFSSGSLLIARRCKKTIESVSVYAWDSKAQAKGEDKPLKENDHHADALRYAVRRVMGRTEIRTLKKPAGF